MDLLLHTIIFLFTWVTLLLPHTIVNATDDKGFSLQLIHRDSIDSPLYPGNLTDIERYERLVQLSESRREWLESSPIKSQDLDMRPIIVHDHDAFIYMVKVAVGRTTAYLALDTGNSLVWVQSEPCNTCFQHDGPSYKPSESPTFKFLRINHRYCVGAYARCKYERRYYGGTSYSRGTLASEIFSFTSKTGGVETIRLVFGSSTNNTVNFFGARKGVSGFFGMDRGPLSFATQEHDRINGRFSYCFVPRTNGANSYLRFGYDIVIRDHYQKTPILRYPDSDSYYVALEGISINGERLNLPRGIFTRHPNGVGGCIMDSGFPASYLIMSAYNAVKGYLVNYFKRFKDLIMINDESHRLCYHMPTNFNHFPSMDFHFHGATLHQVSDHIFVIFGDQNKFCLNMGASYLRTGIGAMAQQNIHFVYDTKGGQLFFAPRNCAES